MVEQDAVRGMQAIGLAIVDRDPIGVELGSRVRRPRIERRGFALWSLDDLAEELRG